MVVHDYLPNKPDIVDVEVTPFCRGKLGDNSVADFKCHVTVMLSDSH